MSSIPFYSNKIERSRLRIGDHIHSYRNGYIYSHHGIYVGDNKVIHYNRTEEKKLALFSSSTSSTKKSRCEDCGYNPKINRGVIKTCLECFLKGHKDMYLFKYDVSSLRFFFERAGMCSTGTCDEPGLVVERAEKMLAGNGFSDYDLWSNNCESFSFYCKTGVRLSLEATYVQAFVDVARQELFSFKTVFNPIRLAKASFKVITAPKIKALQSDKLAHHWRTTG